MRRVLPETAQFAGVLTYLLCDPETVALVEKAPQAARMLRPLCRLLGVQMPAFLRCKDAAADPAPDVTTGPGATAAEEAPGTGPPAAEEAVPEPVVEPAPAPVQPAPVPWHLRRGGLYWDGRRWQWS